MSEKPLLLSSARSGVLLEVAPVSPLWRMVATAAGVVVIIIGAADVASRLPGLLDTKIPSAAFAPVGTLDFTRDEEVPPMPLIPSVLRIPSIGVEADVQAVGVKSDGKTMAAPTDYNDVAWYKPGVKPGAAGNAVFAGHLNSPVLLKSGVFEHLSNVKIGDKVIVLGESGKELTYAVIEMDEYTTALAPLEDIFRAEGPSQIVLVTCEGEWDEQKRTFEKRLVVVARLLPS